MDILSREEIGMNDFTTAIHDHSENGASVEVTMFDEGRVMIDLGMPRGFTLYLHPDTAEDLMHQLIPLFKDEIPLAVR